MINNYALKIEIIILIYIDDHACIITLLILKLNLLHVITVFLLDKTRDIIIENIENLLSRLRLPLTSIYSENKYFDSMPEN